MKNYESETKLSQLFTVFAGIAVFIACLGLLGLASFTALQKSRELSIRKVFGATPFNILTRFSREFMVLIAIAFVVATPISYFMAEQWLENFAYKTELSWWLFVSSGLICTVVTLVTIGFQSIKVAKVNPAITLKNSE